MMEFMALVFGLFQVIYALAWIRAFVFGLVLGGKAKGASTWQTQAEKIRATLERHGVNHA